MRSRLLAIVALASLFLCDAQVNRNPRSTAVEVELSARRNSQKRIEIDCRVRNAGETSIRKVVLFYIFVSPDGKVVSRREGALDTPTLEPGDETEVSLETPEVARAVEIRVEAQQAGMSLNVKKGGPFPIE